MKKIVYSAFACAALAATSIAGTTSMSSGKEYKEGPPPIVPENCFADMELQLDIFGSYTWLEEEGEHEDGAGGGVGVNYFFLRYIGIGADVNLYDGGVHGLWNTTGSLILRFPIEAGTFCIAPYLFGGGGAQFNSETVGTAHAGIGLEYRISPNIGIYTEGRYTWTENNDNDDNGRRHNDDDDDDDDFSFDSDEENNNAQVRLGLRFVF